MPQGTFEPMPSHIGSGTYIRASMSRDPKNSVDDTVKRRGLPLGPLPRGATTPPLSPIESNHDVDDYDTSEDSDEDSDENSNEIAEENLMNPFRTVAEIDFVIEELDSNVEDNEDIEIVRPVSFEDAYSEGDKESETGLLDRLKELKVDEESSDEARQRQYRKKKKRWSAGKFRTYSQSIEGDSSYSDNDPTDDVDESSRRLRRRVRGPGDRHRLVFDDPGGIISILEDDDSRSVSSLADTVFSKTFSQSSQSSTQELMTAKDELLALIQGDVEMRPLYARAMADESIGAERFAKNLHRLLRMYAKDLKEESKERVHYMAAQLMYSAAGYVVNGIRKQYDLEYHERAEKVQSAVAQRNKEKRLNQYLSRLDLGSRHHSEGDTISNDSDGFISDEDAWDNENAQLHTLWQVRAFMVSGQAIKNLRIRLKYFVLGATELSATSKKGNAKGPLESVKHMQNCATDVIQNDERAGQGLSPKKSVNLETEPTNTSITDFSNDSSHRSHTESPRAESIKRKDISFMDPLHVSQAALPDVVRATESKQNVMQWPLYRPSQFLKAIRERVVGVLESLGLCEPRAEVGFQRLRWICVSLPMNIGPTDPK